MFFNESESVDIDCDAPPYPIVRACRTLGFHAPEDVRWCHSAPVFKPTVPSDSGFHLHGWKAFFARPEPKGPTCCCGQELPQLDSYTFTMLSGKEVRFLLGQCSRCSSMHWKEG
jgi:hypothetical protein